MPAEAEVEAEADIIADSAPEMLEAQVVIPAAAETVVLPVADNKPEAPVEKKYSESAERLKKQFFSDDDDSSSDNREPIIVYRDRTGLNPWLMLLVGVIVGMALGYLLSITWAISAIHPTPHTTIPLMTRKWLRRQPRQTVS